jgi:hypothetical protein
MIRSIANDLLVDVLLYLSQSYKQTMINTITSEMNRLYKLFKERNPNFKGKVSIYGHSLGSILAFDILCNQASPDEIAHPSKIIHVPSSVGIDLADVLGSQTEPMNPKPIVEKIDFPILDFEVEKLYCVGSPVALFLLLRGDQIRAPVPGSKLNESGIVRPRCKTLVNLFHPHDVIAYRM